MRLARTMIRTFAEITRGYNTLEKLSKVQNKSPNWITEVLQELEKEGFIIKKRFYKIKNSRIVLEIANTQHALKLKELILQYSTISFEDILADSKLMFLAAISEDWMNMQTAVKLSRISKHMINRYRAALKNRGIIIQKNSLYKINEKAWPILKEFLISYKNYSTMKGIVKWKYEDEAIFEVNSESLINGSITGFAKYADFNIKINFISVLCKIPEARLSKEEVFVHSIFEINDPRSLYLALVFYIKNNLVYSKVLPVAMKYGKYTLFGNIAIILKSKESKIKAENLPVFERENFRRIANVYGVKDV